MLKFEKFNINKVIIIASASDIFIIIWTYSATWCQKIAILIQMQFLNDLIKLDHGFKAAQKFQSIKILIKTINL